MADIRKETISGAKWQLLQKFTLEPLQLVYAMLLARLITPEEMGILGLTAIFFAVAATLSEAGFGAALIRKLDRTDEDINTVFWTNVGISAAMASLLALAAPWFAEFYEQPELLWLTRCSAVLMFFHSLTSVHMTLFSCRRDFKTPALIQFCVSVTAMPVCLFTAWLGWGVWALMVQQATVSILTMLAFWWASPWKPRLIFSVSSFRTLFAFGGNLMLTGLLDTLYSNARTFVIGKFYSAAMLGYYTRGAHLSNMVPLTINRVLNGISYPVLAQVQNDNDRLRNAYRKYIQISTLGIAWVSMCACAMAEPVVQVVYGAQWEGCVPYVRLVAILMSMAHINTINTSLLKVKGRSDLFLRLEIFKKLVSLGMMFYAATISVVAICWAMILYSQLAIFLNSTFSGSMIGLGWLKQQRDYLPYVFLSALSWVPGYFITLLPLHALVQLPLGGLCAFILYFGTLQLLRDSAYHDILISLHDSPKLARFPRIGGVLDTLVRWSAKA